MVASPPLDLCPWRGPYRWMGKPVEITLSVEGMTCAACTGRVERVLRAQAGVKGAEAHLALRQARVVLGEGTDARGVAEQLAAAVTKAGYAAEPLAARSDDARGAAREAEEAGLARDTLIAAAFSLPVVISEMGGHLLPAFHHWLYGLVGQTAVWWMQAVLSALVLAGPGWRFLAKGLPALARAAPEMNSLVALGSLSAWGFSMVVLLAPQVVPEPSRHVYFEAAAVIVTLILMGRWLESRARGQAGAAIARLSQLQPRVARVETPDGPRDLTVGELACDMVVILRAGERVPADGVVISGESTVDESLLTGEPMPVAKAVGDALTAGSLNGAGALRMRVTATGGDTMLARIAAMVADAQMGKLPVQALLDRVTMVFVPVVMGVAVLAAFGWWLAGQGVAPALVAGVSVLIIACPCAMGLATPVSILVATSRAAERGLLFRRGEALQRLAEVRSVAFDKTGPLTMGAPTVVGFHGDAALIGPAAGLEAGADHPIARALLAFATVRGAAAAQARDLAVVAGAGVSAVVEGKAITLGSAAMMGRVPDALAQAADAGAARGETPVFVGSNGVAGALFLLSDRAKPQSAQAVAELQRMGLHVTMISGDRAEVAQKIGASLGIRDVIGGAKPADKAQAIAALAGPVAFVGDGINDAPAMAAAHVGLAIGTGSDVAIEAGDVVLVKGDPLAVVAAVRLGRATMRNIRQNLFWGFGYNAALIPVAAGALVPFGGPMLSPILAAGAMSLSSVFVLANALRLRRVI